MESWIPLDAVVPAARKSAYEDPVAEVLIDEKLPNGSIGIGVYNSQL